MAWRNCAGFYVENSRIDFESDVLHSLGIAYETKWRDMSRTLHLFTTSFPFGGAETYIENEISYLAASFDTVVIVTEDCTSTQIRSVPENVVVKRFNHHVSILEKLLFARHLFSRMAISELVAICCTGRSALSLGIVKTLMVSAGRANRLYHYISEQLLPKNAEQQEHFFYSYWCDDSAVALALLRVKHPDLVCVCRAHGWDVYQQRSEHGYLPFRRFIAEHLSAVCFVSRHGKRHFEVTNRITPNSLRVRVLGSHEAESTVATASVVRDSTFTLVTISSLIPLKRVGLLIDALKILPGYSIRWVHIGDGPMRNALEEQSKSLPVGITTYWTGSMSNEDVLSFLAEQHLDLLVNVSEFEGLPVSMMEAMSCSIPVLATDVGGVSELVEHQHNGMLVAKNVEAVQLAEMLKWFLNLDEAAVNKMRHAAYETWRRKFRASVVFPAFINDLLSLRSSPYDTGASSDDSSIENRQIANAVGR